MKGRLCWLSRYGDCDFGERGFPDPAHLIEKQRIRQTMEKRGKTRQQIAAIWWDPRIIVPLCRHHHGLLDRKLLKPPLTYEDYPQGVRDFASDYGFEFRGFLKGWRGLDEEPRNAQSYHAEIKATDTLPEPSPHGTRNARGGEPGRPLPVRSEPSTETADLQTTRTKAAYTHSTSSVKPHLKLADPPEDGWVVDEGPEAA